MKKLMLMIASLLFVSVIAVNAQVPADSSSVSGQPPVSDDMSNYTRDMTIIQSSEVPAALRSTLQGSEYTGWEEGKIYRNSTTNEYLIVVGDEDAKVYRFDANGTRIENTPAPGEAEKQDSGSGSSTDPDATQSSPTGTTPTGSSPTTPSSPGSTGTSGTTGSGSTPTEK